VLSQTYSNVEVLVIGDGAPAETERALGELADQRVTYENLNRRGPYPGDRRAFWQTAGIPALNRGIFLARGEWFAILNDDDAYRPDFIEALLAIAMADRLEVAYGKLRHHEPNNASWDLGSFPPEDHKFGWQMALQHRSMRMFEYELAAYVFDEPGDWNRARRMLRAGVRFGMLDAVVGDYWPSALWKTSG
jgi:glycosyltransferase involved in cell wall biosynthesis